MQELLLDHHLLLAVMQENNGPCITIEIPTRRDPSARGQNTTHLRLVLEEAIKRLSKMEILPEITTELSERLWGLYEAIDMRISLDGLGIFVSPEISTFVRYPFAIAERTEVGSRFMYRNLLYLKQYCEPYKILLLSKEGARLFSALGNAMVEEKEAGFPYILRDEYEYERPIRGTSFGYAMKSFEKDKGIVEADRLKAFLQEVAEAAQEHILGTTQEVVVAGAKRVLDGFRHLRHSLPVIGEVEGSFGNDNLHELSAQAWYTCNKVKNQNIKEQIHKLDELGRAMIESGADSVWQTAKEGRGQFLMVEKDYNLVQSKDGGGQIDIVDEAIAAVLERKGKVIFTENDALLQYDRILMKLRY